MAENAQIQAWQTNLKGKIHPAAQNAFRLLYDAIQDHDTAIVALNTKVESLTPTTPVTPATPTTPTTPTSGSFPYLGDVNSQTGNAYTTALTDNGGLIVLSFAGTVAVTLTSGVTAPFFVSILNLATGTATLTPSTGNISYTGNIAATSMPILSGGWAILYFDGTNWWSLTAFTTPTGAANLVYATPNGSSGAATLRALVPSDAPFAVVSVAGSAPITSTGGTSPTIAVNLATSGTVGVVKPDGTTTTVNGAGAISAVGTPTVYYGDASDTCVGGESVITLGSTPISGSVKIFLNGVALNSSMYTASGSVFTLNSLTFGAGDIVRATWSTLNSTPGSITVTASGAILNSFGVQSNTGGVSTLIVVNFPAAAAAGNLAVISLSMSNGSLPATPSGWSLVDGSSGSGTFWGGGIYSKTLTSGDISTGSVSFGISALWTAGIVTFSGSPTVTDHITSRNTATPVTLTTGLSASIGYTAVYFGSQGATPGGSTGLTTWNRGTLRGTANDGANDSCALYTEALGASGTVTGVVTYASPTASHNFQSIVVVSTAAVTPGVIPEVQQSQVIGLTSALAGTVTSLTTTGSSGAATLTSGVLNIPVYASGGGGGALTRISQQVLGSPVNTVTFSSIANTFTNLILCVTAGNSTGGDSDMAMQFNGDTGTNYDSANMFGGTSSGSSVTNSTANGPIGSTSGYTGAAVGTTRIVIMNYAQTTFWKESVSQCTRRDSTSQGYILSFGHNWRSTAAINAVRVYLTSGNFVTGSIFTLYGES